MRPSSDSYYGKGYQEIYTRNPKIEKAEELFGWTAQDRARGIPQKYARCFPKGK